MSQLASLISYLSLFAILFFVTASTGCSRSGFTANHHRPNGADFVGRVTEIEKYRDGGRILLAVDYYKQYPTDKIKIHTNDVNTLESVEVGVVARVWLAPPGFIAESYPPQADAIRIEVIEN